MQHETEKRFQVSRVSPQLRAFAARLVTRATGNNESSETKVHTCFRACERLRPHLAPMMGNAAFRVLLARALTLSKPEVPWLRAVQMNEDGSLEGLHEVETRLDPEAITEAEIVLLAQLLGLLVAFIGEMLTLRIVRAAWPQLPLRDVGFTRGSRK